MTLNLLLILVTVFLFSEVSSQSEPILKLPQGDIKGTFERYSKGDFTAFRGIPYAKAPTGSLRLKDPEEHEGWSTTLDATSFGAKCPQWDSQGKAVGEEDCLFINVYTPMSLVSGGSSSSVFPVMVFIHGGNFQKGSADHYGPDRFIENGVVLVTFNYRIGVLGFLSTGDGSCPGNLGLKDQVMALQWVRDNIKSFGGNTSSITLFGQGAGAASVFLHILSPQSQGLFHQAITQSGTPVCDWTLEESPHSYAVEIAERLHCSTKSTSAMVLCIQQKPLSEVLAAQRNNKTFGNYPLRSLPVVEKKGFLPDTPSNILTSGDFKPIPLMSGINRDDGATFIPLIDSYREMLKKNASFLLSRLIPMFILTATDIRGNVESVSQAILFHYFGDVDSTNISQVQQPFVNMTTDAMFVSCNYRTLQSYAAKGARTYMYTFEYKGENSMLELERGTKLNYKGVSHGDELLYLFDIKSAPLSTSNDNRMKEQLHFLWTNFAKTGESLGSINYEYPKWEPYTAELKHYYQIDSTLVPKTAYRQREVDFWLKHLPALSKIRPLVDEPGARYRIGGFGWAMLATAIVLLVVAAVLSVMLLRKSKSRYFATNTEDKKMGLEL